MEENHTRTLLNWHLSGSKSHLQAIHFQGTKNMSVVSRDYIYYASGIFIRIRITFMAHVS